MLTDFALYLALFIVAGGLLMLLTWDLGPFSWTALVPWALVMALIFLLTGCATREPPPPEPPPLPAPVLCAPSVGATEQEPAPDRPAENATQRDVALYLTALHRWGWRGWRRLESVREQADDCASNAPPPTPDEPRD